MKKLKDFFKKAKKEKWAIGQFNFSTFEQLRAIVNVARKLKAPVILGTSQNEINFFGMKEAVLLRDFYRKEYPYIYLNLDHGGDIEILKEVIDLGYDYVHFDGSGLEFQENIKKTKEIVKYAKKRGVMVEGEILSIEGSSEIHKKMIKKIILEDIQKAREFVKSTGIDSLAINIGNLHGIYEKKIRLKIDHLILIKKEVPAFLVLHGGSGTLNQDIKKAIENGVVKININTEIRKVWKESLEDSFKLHKETIKPYQILRDVIKAMEEIIEEKIKLFGSCFKTQIYDEKK